jgi:hypothetical protein
MSQNSPLLQRKQKIKGKLFSSKIPLGTRVTKLQFNCNERHGSYEDRYDQKMIPANYKKLTYNAIMTD